MILNPVGSLGQAWFASNAISTVVANYRLTKQAALKVKTSDMLTIIKNNLSAYIRVVCIINSSVLDKTGKYQSDKLTIFPDFAKPESVYKNSQQHEKQILTSFYGCCDLAWHAGS
jgi:hypothetical protein